MISCRLCGARSISVRRYDVRQLGGYWAKVRCNTEVEIRRCSRFGSYFTNQVPTPELIAGQYAIDTETYYDHHDFEPSAKAVRCVELPSPERRRHPHPAFRLGRQSQHSSALPGARWGLSHHRGRAGVPRSTPPTAVELQSLLDRIIKRLMKLLTRKGYLIEEQGMTYLATPIRKPRSGPCKRQPAPTALRSGPGRGKKS